MRECRRTRVRFPAAPPENSWPQCLRPCFVGRDPSLISISTIGGVSLSSNARICAARSRPCQRRTDLRCSAVAVALWSANIHAKRAASFSDSSPVGNPRILLNLFGGFPPCADTVPRSLRSGSSTPHVVRLSCADSQQKQQSRRAPRTGNAVHDVANALVRSGRLTRGSDPALGCVGAARGRRRVCGDRRLGLPAPSRRSASRPRVGATRPASRGSRRSCFPSRGGGRDAGPHRATG